MLGHNQDFGGKGSPQIEMITTMTVEEYFHSTSLK